MDTHDDAQRTLERKALANVRALVDNLEDRERTRTRDALVSAAKTLPVLALVAVVFVAGSGLLDARRKADAPPPPKDTAEYVDQLYGQIEKKANRRQFRKELENMSGVVRLTFDVAPSGHIDNIQVVGSSWNSAIDSLATRIAKGSAPFGRVPGGKAEPLPVAATFRFARDALAVDGQPAGPGK